MELKLGESLETFQSRMRREGLGRLADFRRWLETGFPLHLDRATHPSWAEYRRKAIEKERDAKSAVSAQLTKGGSYAP